jgi:rhodanese-related sulfurtransferase
MTSLLTTKQLEQATAGGDDFIRTAKGSVVGLALRLDLNPDAPDVIIVGKGIRRELRAKILALQGGTVPTYLKRGVNAWEFVGDYGPYIYKDDAATVQRLVRVRKPNSVAGGLFLSTAAASAKWAVDDERSRLGNRGFPDAATRKAIEIAAVNFVISRLTAEGFTVLDHQALNLGYDLLAQKGQRALRIEVKGTDSPFPRFFLTRNEYKCSLIAKDWQLRVVCEARTNPTMFKYSAEAMLKQFTLDPLAWECTPK